MLAEREPVPVPQPSAPHLPILAAYERFLERDCGLSRHTRTYRLRNAREFLLRHFGEASLDSKSLNSVDLQDYFRRHAGHLKPGSIAVLASSLRSFLRFLALSHGFSPALAASVPMAPQWPMDRLPKALTDGELQAILAHVGTDTPTGRRYIAMIWCMSDLGLRVSEAVTLTLDDIDWWGGTLTVRSSKGRRGRILPIPASLGRAIGG
jgi:integrase